MCLVVKLVWGVKNLNKIYGTFLKDILGVSLAPPVAAWQSPGTHFDPGHGNSGMGQPNLVPRSVFRSLHKSLETAKIIHKILVDDLIFEHLQFYSIEKLNYI
jgi:hypothetical protein